MELIDVLKISDPLVFFCRSLSQSFSIVLKLSEPSHKESCCREQVKEVDDFQEFKDPLCFKRKDQLQEDSDREEERYDSEVYCDLHIFVELLSIFYISFQMIINLLLSPRRILTLSFKE